MASNSSPTPPRNVRYFCHRCVREVDNINQDSFTCPFCNQGFLEELHENEDAHPEIDDDGHNDGANVAAPDFNQFFRTIALPMLFGGGMQPQGQPSSTAAGPAQAQWQQGHQHVAGPFQGFLQNLLEGLAGGGAFQFQVQFNGEDGQPQVFGYPLPLHGNPGDYAWGPGGIDAIVTQLLNQFEGGAPPLTPEQIERIPRVQISQEQVEKRLQCTVCMDDFKLEDNVRQLVCGHHFHEDCIIPWVTRHNTCPVCRKTVSGDADNPSDNNRSSGPSSDGSERRSTQGASRQQQGQQPWDVIEELD